MSLSTELALGKVLIVEDEDDIREVLSMALAFVGHEVSAARSRDEAWKKVLNQNPQIILLDLHMPGMSVTEFVRKVRALRPRPTIILLTADGSVAFIAQQLQVQHWIQKPFTIDELENLVGACMAEHRH